MIHIPKLCKALVFDMDGTMIHNKEYHDAAWIEFCKRHAVEIDIQSFTQAYTGKTNAVILEMVFGTPLSPEIVRIYEAEKEALYRELYTPNFSLVAGLFDLLTLAQQKYIPIAIGTSAPVVNVDFVLTQGNIAHFFDVIVHSAMVTNGKPSPEIYLKVAELLNLTPQECVCFEDSFAGIAAARAADMYTIGIATEQTKDVLIQAGAHTACVDYTHIVI